MTTDTTAAPEVEEATEEAAPVQESPSQDAPPARVDVVYLLQEVANTKKPNFEEWAEHHRLISTRQYAGELGMMRRAECLGLMREPLEGQHARLKVWARQLLEAAPLALANEEEPELDYTDPVVLKYFGVWLWLVEHAPTAEEALSCYSDFMTQDSRSPLDWAKYFDDGLLNLPAFNCHA